MNMFVYMFFTRFLDGSLHAYNVSVLDKLAIRKLCFYLSTADAGRPLSCLEWAALQAAEKCWEIGRYDKIVVEEK